MPVKKVYSKGPNKLLSVSFTDVATGTGFITLYAVDLIIGPSIGIAAKKLVTNIIYGDVGFQAVTGAVDFDFDKEFTQAITLNGDATFSIWASSSGTFSVATTVTLKHVTEGGVETTLGTAISKNMGFANNGELFGGTYNIPKKRFRKGEKFRMTISGTSGANTVNWFHDPKDRAALVGPAYTSSQTLVNIPVEITE